MFIYKRRRANLRASAQRIVSSFTFFLLVNHIFDAIVRVQYAIRVEATIRSVYCRALIAARDRVGGQRLFSTRDFGNDAQRRKRGGGVGRRSESGWNDGVRRCLKKRECNVLLSTRGI